MAENGRDIVEQMKISVSVYPKMAPALQGLESDSLDHVRSILVKTLSSENVSKSDVLKVRRYKKKVIFNLVNVADKESRLRNVKERQNEERQKKLEEIKTQALAAQRFKEKKEEERRRRIDELRVKDDVRRQQVEERKKAINDAERDRLESILRRNQEREARVVAKRRNERSSMVFAFGSSTPRNLDPTDMSVSFWGQRRATSTQNIPSYSSSLTRRQSERELDTGSKKRATSAGGLERSGESSTPTTPAGCVSGYVGRRRTDLVPTIPSRDASFASSRKSLNHSPGRAYSMTRLDQLAKPRKRPEMPALVKSYTSGSTPRPLSSVRTSSVTRSMSHLASKPAPSPPRRPLNKSDSRSMHQLPADGSFAAPRMTRATQLRQQKILTSSNSSDASSRPSSSLSQQSTNSVASSVNLRHRPSVSARKPRPASIAITGISTDQKLHSDKLSGEAKPPLPRVRKSITKAQESKMQQKSKLKADVKTPENVAAKIVESTSNNVVVVSENNKMTKDPGEMQTKPPDVAEEIKEVSQSKIPQEVKPTTVIEEVKSDSVLSSQEVVTHEVIPEVIVEIAPEGNKDVESDIIVEERVIAEPTNVQEENKIEEEEKRDAKPPETIFQPTDTSNGSLVIENNENTANEMTSSINKPRINTEEEAKAALAEKRRLVREEAERLAEQERLRIEMETKAEFERQQREEEQARQLIEQQRVAEQERLQEAIREAQKREEEERLKREEEQRLKLLKEEAENRAREEAERQKAELQERLKNEEKEREARRKRVEAIMLRTRGKNNSNLPSQQNSEDKNENKSENKLNGTKSGEQENGTKNGTEIEIVDNIIKDDSLKNANVVTLDTINSSDSLNSNNSTWKATQQYDSFM